MQNDYNNNDMTALWHSLDSIPQHRKFTLKLSPVNEDNLRFRACDLGQLSEAPTVATELATGEKPAVLTVEVPTAKEEDAPLKLDVSDVTLESGRKTEVDLSPRPIGDRHRTKSTILGNSPDVKNEELYDVIPPSVAQDIRVQFQDSLPIIRRNGTILELPADNGKATFAPAVRDKILVVKGECDACSKSMYIRDNKWLRLCKECSEEAPESENFCVKEALEPLGISASNKYFLPEDFQALADNFGANVYVFSPFGYNKYNTSVAAYSDPEEKAHFVQLAKENAVVLMHQAKYSHVIKAVRFRDFSRKSFLKSRPIAFPLCAGTKKNLKMLRDIALALENKKGTRPLDDRMNAVTAAYPRKARAEAVKLYEEANHKERKRQSPAASPPAATKTKANKQARPPRKKRAAKPALVSPLANPTKLQTITEEEEPTISATYRRNKPKPLPKFGAAQISGSALQTGKIYPVPRKDYFVIDEPSLVSPFTSSDYPAFTASDLIPDLEEGEFEAARWNASDTMLMPFKNQVELAAGMKPYDLQDVARTWARHIEGDGMMPPRFSDTITKKVIAEAIITLDDTNFVEGETVIIVTPNLEASKGALIFRKQPGTTLLEPSNLITAVIPQIDTEVLGPLQNVNASKLSVGIQQSTGADGSVAAFSNKFEGAVTAVSPLSAIPGKLSYATNDHKSISKMVTSETMVICNENYGVPDNLVKTGRSYDAQSDNVLIPGSGGSRPASAILRTGESYAIVAGAKSDDQDLEYGWQLPYEYTMTDEDTVVLWKMSEHPSYLRHVLFGSFRFSFCPGVLYTDSSATADVIKYIEMKVLYSDGTVTNYRKRLMSVADTVFTPIYSGSIEGYGSADQNNGKLIFDVIFSLFDNDAFSGTGFDIKRADTAEVHLEFDSVNAASTYSTVMITGAKKGQTIAVGLTADAEITIDPTGEVARYLVKPPTLCVDPRDLDTMFTILRKSGAHPYFLTGRGTSNIDFEAGDFGKKIKNFFKGAFRAIAPALGTVGRALGGAFGGPAGAAAGSAIGNAIGSLSSSTHTPETLLQICDSAQEYEAATFSGSPGFSRTGFVFPTVDTQGSVARLVDVVKGEGVTKGPDFLRIFNTHLSGSERYTGKSCQLAFLCAALSNIGAPVMAGIYSGEVRNVHKTRNTATFELLPIGHAQEKISTFGGDCMLIMTEKGPTENGLPVDINNCAAFSACTKVVVAKINPPPGFPDQCFRVSLIW